MKNVIIIGAGKGGSALLKLFEKIDKMKIEAVIDHDQSAPGIQIAHSLGIPTDRQWEKWMKEDIDIIFEATGTEAVFEALMEKKPSKCVVVPGSVAYITSALLEEKERLLKELKHQSDKQELILNNIHDGMVVVDPDEVITFMNRSAETILDVEREAVYNSGIASLIPDSRLGHVMKTRVKEINQELSLNNGKKIITTRIPIIGKEGEIQGAFAVFKDITEVVHLAEELTDIKEVKKMLEAIIQSSDEAISVVDEKGNGLMINPAYTRITELKEKDVIGKPASTDISEGESMHMKVLETRRPVRGVRMRVGPSKKDVLVNVAPVIVDGRIKGSVGVLHDVSEIQKLTVELKRARQLIRNLEAKYTFSDIVASSDEMKLALEQARVGAKTPATVLLRGESGTGKELFAHAIHNESKRKHNKFLRINCASMTPTQLESELFGYEEGAYPGVKHGTKKGLFEEAHQGSVFIDEIGDLPLHVQTKLLRLLQEGEVVRIGGTKPIHVDVRIIAATHQNLERAIVNGTFREDLYYRLNRLPIFIPPLRESTEDIDQLIYHLMNRLNQDYGRHVTTISQDALQYLKDYHWPGNVRELENIIGRAMIFMSMNDTIIQKEHLPHLEKENRLEEIIYFTPKGDSLPVMVEQFERQMIKDTMKKLKGNKSETARQLGISLRNLYYKMEKLEIDM
ncbi:sigma-54-dependent Fis family transcriptional regulator [Bacillaceae bacterium S4-13-56]